MPSSNNPGCLTKILNIFGIAPRHIIITDFPYRLRDDFLSPAEASFLHVLQTMTGDKMLICPKVSLAELFFVPQRSNWQTYQNKIDRKRVDFVLCNPQTLKPIFAIELDDSSHVRADRRERDDFVNDVFKSADLPLVHVKTQASYNTSQLAAQFQSALRPNGQSVVASVSPPAPKPALAKADGKPPICPKCGVPMVLRTAKKGNTPGQQFYGCPNYPQCRVIIQLE